MRVACIINPRAGRRPHAEHVIAGLRSVASMHGWELRTVTTTGPGEATQIARSLVPASDIIVAAGGDGTVHEVSAALVGTQVALAVIPCGSGNGFARSFKIPLDPLRAIRSLVDSEQISVDVGTVEGRHFFATAGIGLDAEISRRFAAGNHRRGIWPYFRHGFAAWVAYCPQKVTIQSGNMSLSAKPLVLAVANTEQYGGGAKIAPGASPFDGLLNITIVEVSSFLRLLIAFPRLFTGSLDRSPLVRRMTATEFTIHRQDPGPYHADGEPFDGPAVLHFSVVPHALRLLVPRGKYPG
ncbi:MAG TPA: diacylglycerol kinase family lipid kinase [Candidatus Latescibacteria bacterium]|nr:diacylglycerol kinase family lipid kinase [Candidatus Latescibacterota bacterium]